MHRRLLLSLIGAVLLLFGAQASLQAQEIGSCAGLPDHGTLRTILQEVVAPGGNGGFDLNMWATIVDRDGVVCVVAFSGEDRGDQWPGSRVISAQKANTANAFSLPGLALSTANLFTAVQPGNSLFGLQHSNPVDTSVAYGGDATLYGQVDDPMVGERIGGVNVFGGGLALYDMDGFLRGAIGLSGDSSCADHNIAWKVRDALALDFVPAGVSETGDDNIVYDETSGWAHATCGLTELEVSPALPVDFPIGSGDMADMDNIILSVESAPIVPNGLLAGEPTDINIHLTVPGEPGEYFRDPALMGWQIPAGGRMEVELGGTFERNGIDNDAEFVSMDSGVYLILLPGNPQNPIVPVAGAGVQHGNYSVSDDGDQIIVITPNGGEGDNGLEGARATEIGVKTVHILPLLTSEAGPAPFQNGPAGTTGNVDVRIFDAEGTLLESGSATVEFPDEVGRQVFPTNFGLATAGQLLAETATAELIETTNFQRVAPQTELVNTERGEFFSEGQPYALRFLLFEAQALQPDPFAPMIGLPEVGIIVDDEDPSMGLLVQDTSADGLIDAEADTVVGSVMISGPSNESRGEILAIDGFPLTITGDGATAPNGSILNVPVRVGAEEGTYAVTVSLDGGNSATLYIVVVEEDDE